MAEARDAVGTSHARTRRQFDALSGSATDWIVGCVLDADPGYRWPTEGSVFQYTRFDTLRGLLGTGVSQPEGSLSTLWATSSMFLNDSSEFLRGREVFESVLQHQRNDPVNGVLHRALRAADSLEVYCACFSAVDDDLSQWRGYGENGAGVCIEFDVSEMRRHLDGIGYWVIYGKPKDDAFQVSVATEVLRYMRAAISQAISSSTSADVRREIREQLRDFWPALLLVFKHADFQAEREFRMVYSGAIGRGLETCFRPHPLVPYVKLQMDGGRPLPIKSIRLGPAVSREPIRRSLRLALDSRGFKRIAIKTSSIPYVPN